MGRHIVKLTPAEKALAKKLGRIGGHTRAKNLTAEERRASAMKAARASVKARKERASKKGQ
jgi:hypothetical protein